MEWTHRVVGGPWAGRVGLRCALVPDPGDGVYPFDKRDRTHVVVLIEDDPYTPPQGERPWTCVISRSNLCALADPCFRVGCIGCDFALPDPLT